MLPSCDGMADLVRSSKLKMLGANLDFHGANRVFARQIAVCEAQSAGLGEGLTLRGSYRPLHNLLLEMTVLKIFADMPARRLVCKNHNWAPYGHDENICNTVTSSRKFR